MQNNISREKKLIKNIFILAFGTVLPRLASLVTLPVVTSGLTKEEYGIYDLVLVLISLLLPAVTMQIHVAAFRFLIDEKSENERKTIISSIFAVNIPLSLIALIILFFVVPVADSIIKIEICSYLLVDMILVSCQWIVRGFGKSFHYSVSAVVNAILRMLLCILFISIMHMGLSGAIISQIIANAITLIYLLVIGKIIHYLSIHCISKMKIKQMLSYSWPLVPNDLSMWVMKASDRFVITAFMGVSANAVYAVANKIPNLLSMAQSTFTMAWQESAAASSKDSDASVYYSSMFEKLYNFVSGFLSVLIGLSPILFKLLIRGEYGEAYFQMPILFMSMFFNSISAYLGGIYVACKSTKNIALTTFIGAICNIVVDLLLIKYIGLYAASISTFVSYMFLALYRMYDIKKIVRLSYNYRKMLFIFIFIVCELILFYSQKKLFNLIIILFGFVFFYILNHELLNLLIHKLIKTE